MGVAHAGCRSTACFQSVGPGPGNPLFTHALESRIFLLPATVAACGRCLDPDEERCNASGSTSDLGCSIGCLAAFNVGCAQTRLSRAIGPALF